MSTVGVSPLPGSGMLAKLLASTCRSVSRCCCRTVLRLRSGSRPPPASPPPCACSPRASAGPRSAPRTPCWTCAAGAARLPSFAVVQELFCEDRDVKNRAFLHLRFLLMVMRGLPGCILPMRFAFLTVLGFPAENFVGLCLLVLLQFLHVPLLISVCFIKVTLLFLRRQFAPFVA